MNGRQLIKFFTVLKIPFTFYIIASIIVAPSIGEINAQVIYGAHRGASVEHEENTLEAFEAALEDPKYQFVEFDITYTKDDKIAVIHQNNKFRLPKNGAVVRDLEMNELREKFEFYVPEYGEVMDILAGNKPLDIEIKTTKDFEKDKELVEFVIKETKERGISDQIMISSISSDIVEYIEINYPEIDTGKIYWITFKSILPWESKCKEIYETPADYVLIHGYNVYNFETLMKCKPENKDLMIWYFTDEVYIVGEGNEFWLK
jgi:glycerophosphoryl diester phosphodiesterase